MLAGAALALAAFSVEAAVPVTGVGATAAVVALVAELEAVAVCILSVPVER